MKKYKELDTDNIEYNDEILEYIPTFPSTGITFEKDNNNEQYIFRAWTNNDITNLENIVDEMDENKFFNLVGTFLKEKQDIFKIGDLRFKYYDLMFVGYCFVMELDCSTFDRDYNHKDAVI